MGGERGGDAGLLMVSLGGVGALATVGLGPRGEAGPEEGRRMGEGAGETSVEATTAAQLREEGARCEMRPAASHVISPAVP